MSVLLKAKALHVLFSTSCPNRVRKSEYIRHLVSVKNNVVKIKEYEIELDVQLRGSNLPKVSHNCTCRDWGKSGPCKHVLAYAYVLIKQYHEEWKQMSSTE